MSDNSGKKVLRIGSRKSELALIQTHHVVKLLENNFPDLKCEVIARTTIGDQILDKALSKIGEKNLFTKELETSLESGEVDLIVHSLKDLPTTLPPKMVIGAILEREDPRDAVIIKKNLSSEHSALDSLPSGSAIGTSSVRRAAQLKVKYPALEVADVRGNLNTRLKKLDCTDREEYKVDYSALILAAAGVKRMGWEDRISQFLNASECLHAVGQGALAIETRQGDMDTLKYVGTLQDRLTALACIAERAFMRTLEGGCSAPVAAHAEITDGGSLRLEGGVWSLNGEQELRADMERKLDCEEEEGEAEVKKRMTLEEQMPEFASVVASGSMKEGEMRIAETLGEALANKLLEKGAGKILAQAKAENSS